VGGIGRGERCQVNSGIGGQRGSRRRLSKSRGGEQEEKRRGEHRADTVIAARIRGEGRKLRSTVSAVARIGMSSCDLP
jgi:hypothetical protein